MNKTTFTIAAIAAAAQAVHIQGNTSASLDNFLAQVEQSWRQHTCSSAMDVLKGANVNFDTASTQSTPWTDTDFPTDHALYWRDQESNTKFASTLPNNITWRRISENGMGVQSLWGPGGQSDIKPADINQGRIGNCWILSAISAVAEVPGRISNLMLNDGLNSAGVYGVNMYSLGVPTTIYVDDFLPVTPGWNSGEYRPMFAGLGKDNSIWGAIVEKAYAKKYGNYQHTEGGWMATGVASLNGSPFRTYQHKEMTNDRDLWAILQTHDLAVDVMTAGTKSGSDTDRNWAGLAYGHAYTVLGVMTMNDGTQLIKMRNPWGSEWYTGPWSDNSYQWNNQNRAEVNSVLGGATQGDDGIFFIDIATYRQTFADTHINFDTSSMSFGSWLMLDDQTQGAHTIKVTNDSGSSQKIHVGSHIWQDRTYSEANRNCNGATRNWRQNFSITSAQSGDSAYMNLVYGSAWLQSIEFTAGETKEFNVQMDWARQGIVKDFSVTAWGEGGAVTVTHQDGISSATLPLYEQAQTPDVVDPVVPVVDPVVVPVVDPIVPIDNSWDGSCVGDCYGTDGEIHWECCPAEEVVEENTWYNGDYYCDTNEWCACDAANAYWYWNCDDNYPYTQY